MHFFRSEEHIDRWCQQWQLDRGAVLSIEQAWRLARAWYGSDRRDPGWRRKTAEEVAVLFAEIGLTGEFWSLQ